jgi:hypothetical protein
MSKSPAKAKCKKGGPHGRRPRPHIEIPGDVLVPKGEAAKELGIATRTLTRMRPPFVLVGGICYVAMGKLREQIADSLSSAKRRARR